MRFSNPGGPVRAILIAAGLLGSVPTTSPAQPGATPETAVTCLDCHQGLAASTAHAGLACVACHVGVGEPPHDEGELQPACATCHGDVEGDLETGLHAELFAGDCGFCHGAAHEVPGEETFRPQVDATCGGCHDEVLAAVERSAHGAVGRGLAPVCSDCHGAHHTHPANDPDSPVYHLNVAETCSACHGNEDLRRIAALEDVSVFHESIHGWSLEHSGLLVAPSCVTCHGAHGVLHPQDPASPVSRNRVAATCGECHAGIFRRYQDSIHGRLVSAGRTAPVCVDCHSSHGIRTALADEWLLGVVAECGTCHEDLYSAYRRSFHGQATALGFAPAAKCSDCHGAHDISRAESSASLVSEAQRLETCRTCHPRATPAYLQYVAHPDPHDRSHVPIYWSARLMQGLLAAVFLFFGIHTVLWLPRSLQERLRRARSRQNARAPEVSR